jgi:hypothetical protein
MSTAMNRSKAEYLSMESLNNGGWTCRSADHEVEHVRPVLLLRLREDERLTVALDAVRQLRLRVVLLGLEEEVENPVMSLLRSGTNWTSLRSFFLCRSRQLWKY